MGRGREIASLRGLLETSRLVTLTGSGGSGKTRLAGEVATVVAGDFPDGIAFVELASLTDGALVVVEIAAALDVRGPAAHETIAARIGHKRALLVLDNCEHMVGPVAAVVVALLRECPRLVVLTTSREALAVPGEVAWLVPPLSLPDPAQPATPASLEASEAVKLFVDRAADVVPSFRLTEANAADVAGICRRLDGIPLALELAAARLRTLGPAQLLARLDGRFSVLSTRARTTLPRHRTLRAAIDWSYDLLSEAERGLMASLSVFSGTFDLDAAEGICSDDAVARDDVLDLVSGLVEKSLLEVVEHGSVVRYRLLETVRQYAREKLDESGRAELMARRHAAHFLTQVDEAEPHFTLPSRRVWIDRISQDADNIRTALAWTRQTDPAAHLRLVGQLGWYWFGTEHWSEGRRWLQGALALPEAEARTSQRASALFALGVLTSLQGVRDVARPALEECMTLAEELCDERLRAYARNYLGLSYAGEGSQEAVPLLEKALEYFRAAEDLYGARLALLCLGVVARVGGELGRAAVLTEEAVEAARVFGQDRELSVSLRQLALVELCRGDSAKAGALAREALACLRRDPQHYFIAMSLEVLAAALADLGHAEPAARLFGAGERIRDGIGVSVVGTDAPIYDPRIGSARVSLGEDAFGRAWEQGRNLSVAEALDLALSTVSVPPALPSQPGGLEAPPAGGLPEPAVEPGPPPAGQVADVGYAGGVGAALSVAALGPLEVRLAGAPLASQAWSHARPRELLIFLLTHPKGRTRQEVGDALWPDSSPAQVKNSFHVALHHLRKTLGKAEWVRFEEDRYRIAAEFGVWFDVDAFDDAARRALREARSGAEGALVGLRSALALYRGDFLVEESAGGWHLEHQDRLRQLYVDGLVELGRLLLDAGSLDEALEVSGRVVLLDELHEGAHRQLMVAHARSGDRRRAIRQFERLSEILRDEIGAAPEAATLSLHQRILAAEAV